MAKRPDREKGEAKPEAKEPGEPELPKKPVLLPPLINIPKEYSEGFGTLQQMPINYIGKVEKKGKKKSQPAMLVLCPDHVYVCSTQGDINRCIPIEEVHSIAFNKTGSLAIRVPSQYDLLVDTNEWEIVANVLEPLYAWNTKGKKLRMDTTLTDMDIRGLKLTKPNNFNSPLTMPQISKQGYNSEASDALAAFKEDERRSTMEFSGESIQRMLQEEEKKESEGAGEEETRKRKRAVTFSKVVKEGVRGDGKAEKSEKDELIEELKRQLQESQEQVQAQMKEIENLKRSLECGNSKKSSADLHTMELLVKQLKQQLDAANKIIEEKTEELKKLEGSRASIDELNERIAQLERNLSGAEGLARDRAHTITALERKLGDAMASGQVGQSTEAANRLLKENVDLQETIDTLRQQIRTLNESNAHRSAPPDPATPPARVTESPSAADAEKESLRSEVDRLRAELESAREAGSAQGLSVSLDEAEDPRMAEITSLHQKVSRQEACIVEHLKTIGDLKLEIDTLNVDSKQRAAEFTEKTRAMSEKVEIFDTLNQSLKIKEDILESVKKQNEVLQKELHDTREKLTTELVSSTIEVDGILMSADKDKQIEYLQRKIRGQDREIKALIDRRQSISILGKDVGQLNLDRDKRIGELQQKHSRLEAMYEFLQKEHAELKASLPEWVGHKSKGYQPDFAASSPHMDSSAMGIAARRAREYYNNVTYEREETRRKTMKGDVRDTIDGLLLNGWRR